MNEDFCSLAACKHYLPSIRGFSWLTASINPNNVIWDIFSEKQFHWHVKLDKTLIIEEKENYANGIEYQRKLNKINSFGE